MQLIEAIAGALRTPAFKFFLILFLTLLLMVPLAAVYALLWDRESRAQEVQREVGRLWGPEQQILGPFLVVPYTVRIESLQGDKRIEQIQERRAVFTPEVVDIDGRSEAKTLRRSIFDVPVYTARLKLSGRFAAPRLAEVVPEAAAVRWRDATFVLGLSGMAGLKEATVLKLGDGREIAFAPSLGMPATSLPGIHARLAAAGAAAASDPGEALGPLSFSVDLAFNGSVALGFAPVARDTRVALASNWPHPSFAGAFLPDEREVGAAGFKARWKVPHLARSVPEAWSLTEAGLERLSPHAFGVRMVDPVDFYSVINRAVKYGVLFVALAFMTVFCLELRSARPVHAVQYLFTGLALVFFYVLLLAVAEHLGFALAYGLAALCLSLTLSLYVGTVLASRRQGALVLAVLGVVYGLLYLILQLEDYALVAGALLGFVALTSAMFGTLGVKWSKAVPSEPMSGPSSSEESPAR